jgi:hypothetical protein
MAAPSRTLVLHTVLSLVTAALAVLADECRAEWIRLQEHPQRLAQLPPDNQLPSSAAEGTAVPAEYSTVTHVFLLESVEQLDVRWFIRYEINRNFPERADPPRLRWRLADMASLNSTHPIPTPRGTVTAA